LADLDLDVIPAQAGIQIEAFLARSVCYGDQGWIPACAGMTLCVNSAPNPGASLERRP
jgi:hypothetical protein